VTIDLAIYPLAVVMRASHAFTARGSVFIRSVDGEHAVVEISPHREGIDGEFANALLDAQLRAQIADETKWIRELIVAQAFCEADLLDRGEIEGDESTDPRGITR
jgi:His-Xaa-Ser system protein HxsD